MAYKVKKESFFWTSFSDLMMSLFFVMLILFVLLVGILHNKLAVTQDKLDKIKRVEESVKKVDTLFFAYNETHRKHVMKVKISFPAGSSDMETIPPERRRELLAAGRNIIEFLDKHKDYSYLIIIEGQASRDNYKYNYGLSYGRALSLVQFWQRNGVRFNKKCELLISGSGDGQVGGTATMRETNEAKNQRFLVHIIPKHEKID
ncbi:MAG: hypothetical protein HUK09_01795 [Bacteroidaceae bacterium]|nr:hypothetical protein [Bacteroidaceae bacterium]